MRPAVLIAAVGIPAYAICLVLAAPATFIAARASHALDGRLHARDAEGALWSGSLHASLDAPGGRVALDRVAWRLLPARILDGRIAFDVQVQSRGVNGHAEVARSWSQWEARNATARAEARMLPVFFPLAAAWRPEGPVSVDATDGAKTVGTITIDPRAGTARGTGALKLAGAKLTHKGKWARADLRLAGQADAALQLDISATDTHGRTQRDTAAAALAN